MKILIVNDYSSTFGGAENSIDLTKKLLIDKGHTVELFYGSKSKFNIFTRLFSFYYFFKLSYFLLFNKIDIIHYNKINLVLSPSILIVGRIFNVKQIITIHDFGIICPDGWMIDNYGKPCNNGITYKCLFKKCGKAKQGKYLNSKLYVIYNYYKNRLHIVIINKFINNILFPSKSILSYGKKSFDNNKCIYLPNFIEIEESYYPNFTKIEDNRFLYVGRLSNEKGILVAIKAIDLLVKNENITDIYFEIIGAGPNRTNLENLVLELGLQNNIKFLGKIDNSNLNEYYEKSIGLLIPSICLENNPLVAIEGMKYGKAIIGSNVGGIPDLIEDGKNGYLFPIGNHIELADKIKNLYKNKDLSMEMGKYGFEKLKREFGSELFYKRLKTIYES